MATPLFFLPGATTKREQQLVDVGLVATLKEAAGAEWADIAQGHPSGQPGQLVTWRTGNAERDQLPSLTEAIEWHAVKKDPAHDLAAGRYWIGVDPSRPIEPEDLQRRKDELVPGKWVLLADGSAWSIPVAVNLPHRHQLNEEGEFVRTVRSEFSEFYDASERYAQQVFQALGLVDLAEFANERARSDSDKVDQDKILAEVPLEESYEFALMALRLNYRMNRDLADLLGLFDDTSQVRIVLATMEFGEIEQTRRKKKRLSTLSIPVGSITSSGGGAS